MASRSLASLSCRHVRRGSKTAQAEQARLLPVRGTLATDLRLFVVAWGLGFIAFLLFIA